MKVTDFTYLLQKPESISSVAQINQLEEIITDYPYFQAAHAVHLKGLKNTNSFKYNNALKVTAAHTANRDVLFDFITSPEFLDNSNKVTAITELAKLKEMNVTSEEVASPPNMLEESIDKPLPQNLDDAEKILNDDLFETKEPVILEKAEDNEDEIEEEDEEEKPAEDKTESEKLNIGEPLHFTKKEKHSFAQWLELATPKPEEEPEEFKKEEPKKIEEKKPKKNTKFDLIDKFIKNNPKISPAKNIEKKVDISNSVKLNKDELMTETLAKVYLEQKKYKKAIQAYRILSLKYPEKSSFFADRIKSVQKIQKENI
ncbi:hypothetical protein [Cellulophaga fucicola]|uniref:Tetratricopeptide repeat-containing protein n=1 Tax=Cellulophaga fucicola TaxID=76595 RepID=A0A1K1QV47_9FLAO|nr:hypothetical protein [Cellulophaga fucicola]SFW63637.1 hypothetical protein SAMN05660313_02988 [Cellulophaga fucicola]